MNVGVGTPLKSRNGYDDDGDRRMKRFDFVGEIIARNILQAAVQNDSIDGWKTSEDLQRLSAAVRREDVELGSLNDEFAS